MAMESDLDELNEIRNETCGSKPQVSTSVSNFSWALESLERVFSKSSAQKQQTLMAIKHLEVDTEILRGIPFHKVLQQPRLWLSPSLFRHTARGAEVWNRSQKVAGFDFFISHTWRTPGRGKILSLVMQSGWLHGLLGWLCGVALILCLEWLDIIPPFTIASIRIADVEYDAPISPWVIIAGWFSMILGVCSSPYLSLGRQICFLDMTSIHQSDNELLQRGIYSIGGCLSVSKELRVLYSPPYFGSLWCLFELVAFRNSNPTGKIKFLPLFLERSVLVGACALFVLSLIQWAVVSMVDSDFRSPNLQTVSLLMIPVVMCMVHTTRRNYGEKQQLMEDLKFFDLEKVSCVSDFDNAFIHSAINSWYGSKDAFTEFVRGPLREELCALLPSPHLSWTYVAFMVSSAVSYRLELILSISRAGADPDFLLLYVLVSAGFFGWLWPSFNGLFFLCDKTCTIRTTGSSTMLLDWGKTFVVAIVFTGSLIVAEALSTFVLRSQNLWVGTGYVATSLLLPYYIWGRVCC